MASETELDQPSDAAHLQHCTVTLSLSSVGQHSLLPHMLQREAKLGGQALWVAGWFVGGGLDPSRKCLHAE